jgi:hypothetical protein
MPVLKREESKFLNKSLFAVDAKAVNLDNTLLNLFMLIKHNGNRPRTTARRTEKDYSIDRLIEYFNELERKGEVRGFSQHPDAVRYWIRCNLVNLVFRGNTDKEKLSALKPIHLESYRIRNPKHARDYNTADQVYLMLRTKPLVMEKLADFLKKGWKEDTKHISTNQKLDVDSVGILHLIKNINPGFINTAEKQEFPTPLLLNHSELFCDDIRRLLVYNRTIPRAVLIDYLKNIIAFHLSLYIQKLVYLLPKMVAHGTMHIPDDWSIVIDITDNLSSKVGVIASADAEKMGNNLYDYIKATFQINAALTFLSQSRSNPDAIELALEKIKNRTAEFEMYFKSYWNFFTQNLEEDDMVMVDKWVKYEDHFFDKYIELLLHERGDYQYKYNTQLIDNLSQKNNENGMLASGKSRKHPRRFVMGTKLLETLVQLLVLEEKDDSFITKSLSIEELTRLLRSRYGLIINGLNEPRFDGTDLQTHLAFTENIEAFKAKLRQIGFYNDLSDAYVLQKIRPRYQING